MQRKSYLSLSIIILSTFFASHCMNDKPTIHCELVKNSQKNTRKDIMVKKNGTLLALGNIQLTNLTNLITTQLGTDSVETLKFYNDKNGENSLILNGNGNVAVYLRFNAKGTKIETQSVSYTKENVNTSIDSSQFIYLNILNENNESIKIVIPKANTNVKWKNKISITQNIDTISFKSTTAGRREIFVPHINGSTYNNIPLPSQNIDDLFYFYDKDSRHFLIINKENLKPNNTTRALIIAISDQEVTYKENVECSIIYNNIQGITDIRDNNLEVTYSNGTYSDTKANIKINLSNQTDRDPITKKAVKETSTDTEKDLGQSTPPSTLAFFQHKYVKFGLKAVGIAAIVGIIYTLLNKYAPQYIPTFRQFPTFNLFTKTPMTNSVDQGLQGLSL